MSIACAAASSARAPRVDRSRGMVKRRDGIMTFDYRLRPGIVEKSNALELMRSVGLDVTDPRNDLGE